MLFKSGPFIKTRRRHSSIGWRVKNCNDPLSKLEIDSIHASVRDARGDLEHIQRDLKRAQMTVQALSKEHNTTTKFIARELALLSPIRSLPREMLSKIKVHHSRMFAEHDRYIKASLVVLQVCTGWQSITHATAVLWISLYKAWLVRVGALSCDVALWKAPATMKHRYYDDDDDGTMEDARPRVSIWQFPDVKEHWTVHIPNPALIKRSDVLVEKGPKLEELVFQCKEDMFDVPVLMPRLPLTTVKRCEMEMFPMTNGLQILQGATALETLKWMTAYADTENLAEIPVVTTTIHTLDLSIWGLPNDGLSPLFAHLTAPNLEILKILWIYHPDPDGDVFPFWQSTPFNAFLTRSAISLTSLALLHAALCEADLIALLEQTLLLIKFKLSNRYTRKKWGEDWAEDDPSAQNSSDGTMVSDVPHTGNGWYNVSGASVVQCLTRERVRDTSGDAGTTGTRRLAGLWSIWEPTLPNWEVAGSFLKNPFWDIPQSWLGMGDDGNNEVSIKDPHDGDVLKPTSTPSCAARYQDDVLYTWNTVLGVPNQ
ncbi:hypothetical protein B0H12DRAFT_1239037 [Mycena haematopus]|nr:hypothetical protein B0H12DRAFT_1239037 [Mycena haematopus]